MTSRFSGAADGDQGELHVNSKTVPRYSNSRVISAVPDEKDLKKKKKRGGPDSDHSYFSDVTEGGTRVVKRRKRIRDEHGNIIGYGKEEIYHSGALRAKLRVTAVIFSPMHEIISKTLFQRELCVQKKSNKAFVPDNCDTLCFHNASLLFLSDSEKRYSPHGWKQRWEIKFFLLF